MTRRTLGHAPPAIVVHLNGHQPCLSFHAILAAAGFENNAEQSWAISHPNSYPNKKGRIFPHCLFFDQLRPEAKHDIEHSRLLTRRLFQVVDIQTAYRSLDIPHLLAFAIPVTSRSLRYIIKMDVVTRIPEIAKHFRVRRSPETAP
jgi:hypothetical protein